MSYTYDLFCIPCRQYFHLGKIWEPDGETSSSRFGGWKGGADFAWLGGTDLLLCIERFLILHRGHQLHVLPEYSVEDIDDDEAGIHQVESSAELFNQPVEPMPHPDYDVTRVPAEVENDLKMPHVSEPSGERSITQDEARSKATDFFRQHSASEPQTVDLYEFEYGWFVAAVIDNVILGHPKGGGHTIIDKADGKIHEFPDNVPLSKTIKAFLEIRTAAS